jgi:hypothetical protein
LSCSDEPVVPDAVSQEIARRDPVNAAVGADLGAGGCRRLLVRATSQCRTMTGVNVDVFS